jgi:hypothetical protein
MTRLLALGFCVMALGLRPAATNAGQFIQERTPAPRVDSRLMDTAVSPTGRVVSVGDSKEAFGGSPTFPLILEKSSAEGSWELLSVPDLGNTWHELSGVAYLPGPDEDFVAVGQYSPPGAGGDMQGLLLRYHRATDRWDIRAIDIGSRHMGVEAVAVDPSDPNRILIAGTAGDHDDAGGCFRFNSMLLEYRLDTFTLKVAPSVLGDLSSVVIAPDHRVFAFGILASECDYVDLPLALEFDPGLEQVTTLPNPTTVEGHPAYRLTGATSTSGGKIFVVGTASKYALGAFFLTLAYELDPTTHAWVSHKPLDPDRRESGGSGYINHLWTVKQGLDGRIYAVGRYGVGTTGSFGYSSMIQSFDGHQWTLHEIPEAISRSELRGLAIGPNKEVYAAGLKTDFDGNYFRNRTLVFRSRP